MAYCESQSPAKLATSLMRIFLRVSRPLHRCDVYRNKNETLIADCSNQRKANGTAYILDNKKAINTIFILVETAYERYNNATKGANPLSVYLHMNISSGFISRRLSRN